MFLIFSYMNIVLDTLTSFLRISSVKSRDLMRKGRIKAKKALVIAAKKQQQ